MKDWKKNDFWKNIPSDCVKAIKELQRLKVYRLCAFDYEETFSDVWWLVLHEVDMYAEGEFCKEAGRSEDGVGDPAAMDMRNAQAADRWLVRWNELFNKYTAPEYYSEYYHKVHSPMAEYWYGGQVI